MVFGTWKNPERWTGENGFQAGASARIPEMLVGVDVSTPRAPVRDRPSIESLAG